MNLSLEDMLGMDIWSQLYVLFAKLDYCLDQPLVPDLVTRLGANVC